MTSFYDTLKTYDWDDVKQNIMDKSKNDAIAAINNPHRTLDLPGGNTVTGGHGRGG